ncbi:unnamed protein product [Darwinula stevensoni]|uniref:Calponin-homology (CH) domain-containing protein n=1 Tax=Darwinula stevensoni TaxID=69355 RepID=A0A7R8XBH4_9CRUS|nr:unnamed protein product [Darwinula stevensoni]CAG0886479.1 unnamed protein product [Darwinula stevensoni]
MAHDGCGSELCGPRAEKVGQHHCCRLTKRFRLACLPVIQVKWIYTDWGNHYLEKGKCKKRIGNLETDVVDGVLLADLIEAVTNQKVGDINRKPKGPAQMLENVRACVNFLACLGVTAEGVTPKDIRDGNLRAILGLLFSLSRYKQQLKQQQLHLSAEPSLNMTSKLPAPSSTGAGRGPGGSGIPGPGTGTTSGRRSSGGGGASRNIPNFTPTRTASQPGSAGMKAGLGSAESSRSASPSGQGQPVSFIPTPRSSAPKPPSRTLQGQSSVGRSSLRLPSNNQYARDTHAAAVSTSANVSPRLTKGSMLDRFNVFNKERQEKGKGQGMRGSKRTSSSSGVSSARSEQSDSSASTGNGGLTLGNSSQMGVVMQEVPPPVPEHGRTALRTLSSKLKGGSPKMGSPKMRRKDEAKGSPKSSHAHRSRIPDSQRQDQDIPEARKPPPPEPKKAKRADDLGASRLPVLGQGMIPKPTAAVKGTSKIIEDKVIKANLNTSATSKHFNKVVTHVGGAKSIRLSPTNSEPNVTQANEVKQGHDKDKGKVVTGEKEGADEEEEALNNIQPMQPLLRASQYGYLRGLGLISPLKNGGSQQVYAASHVSSPGAAGALRSFQQSPDTASGYMSDGDLLCGAGIGHDVSFEDHLDGYMSEGGAGLYGRKPPVLAQGRGGRSLPLPSTDDSMEKEKAVIPPPLPPHAPLIPLSNGLRKLQRLDETSSLSSGVSDALAYTSTDDNLTSSSVASEPNPYLSFKRSSREGGNDGDGVQYKVVSPRAHSKKTDSSQQTDTSAFRQVIPCHGNNDIIKQGSQWKKVSLGAERGDPSQDYPSMEAKKKSGKGEKTVMKTSQGSQTVKVGVGDVKRIPHPQILHAKGSSLGFHQPRPASAGEAESSSTRPKTAAVTGIPRTPEEKPRMKLKVSGSTQTQIHQTVELPSSTENWKPRTFSMSPSVAAQLSQNVRERILQSSNWNSKTLSHTGEYLYVSGSQRSPRMARPTDGSLSDSTYMNYAELRDLRSATGSPYSWGRFSGGYPGSMASSQLRKIGGSLTEGESMESLSSAASYQVGGIQMQSQAGRSGLTQARLLLHQNQQDSPAPGNVSPRLNRSSSARSSKSEKQYPIVGGEELLARANGGRYSFSSIGSHHASQPASPTPSNKSGFILSPIMSVGAQSPYAVLSRTSSLPQEEEVHGSHLSLLSGGSSLYSSQEERQAAEIRKLRKELVDAQQKVHTLTSQLSTNNVLHTVKGWVIGVTWLGNRFMLHLDSYARSDIGGSRGGMNGAYPGAPGPIQRPLSCTDVSTASPYSYVCAPTRKDVVGLGSVGNSSSYRLDRIQFQPMETVWEERVCLRPRKQLPWWEIATRRNKYRSCPLFQEAHVVAAFEQSLSNMTQRLQHLTSNSEKKEHELGELKATIDILRKQGNDAGLNLQSRTGTSTWTSTRASTGPGSRSVGSSMGMGMGSPWKGAWSPPPHAEASLTLGLARRHTFNSNKDTVSPTSPIGVGGSMSRQLSTDSVSSLSSACSGVSHASNASPSNTPESPDARKKKKRSWLRSSFSKAFVRGVKKPPGKDGEADDVRGTNGSIGNGNGVIPEFSIPSSPIPSTKGKLKDGSSYLSFEKEPEKEHPDVVQELKKQLREKDMVLTDIRLEALTSAHQLESLKETVSRMRSEMLNLRHDNERLQRLVTSKSLTSSQNSLPPGDGERRLSLSDNINLIETHTTSLQHEPIIDLLGGVREGDGHRITISVQLGFGECLIGSIYVSGKTKWDILDDILVRIFKEYTSRLDAGGSLGLTEDSIDSYLVGEVHRRPGVGVLPELLPCGYLVGDVQGIQVTVKGASHGTLDSLAFDTLISKSVLQSVDHKNGKELHQYLTNLGEQVESGLGEVPTVILLDNLHYVGSLADIFSGFLNPSHHKCPYIIGTMSQTSPSPTNIQLHHNFRWVLYANHVEPVKGFLNRYLKRRLIAAEVTHRSRLPQLARIFDWIARLWAHINKFIEAHASSDLTIGPRLFLNCPADVGGSQVWFRDLWNYSLVPYILEALREGVHVYGKKGGWEDPTQWIVETYPWNDSHASSTLHRLKAEDIGYETESKKTLEADDADIGENESDPLLNMLLKLQEAAKDVTLDGCNSSSGSPGSDGNRTMSPKKEVLSS